MKHLTRLLTLTLIVAAPLAIFSQGATYEDVINKKVKGNIKIYQSKSGEVFQVGDTITLGSAFRNEAYDYILQNAGIALYPLENTASGSLVKIKRIQVWRKLVYVFTTTPNGLFYPLKIVNFEGALANGEVETKLMTSDQALEELKKWKDKLDLELISEEEYNKKKKELAKFIN